MAPGEPKDTDVTRSAWQRIREAMRGDWAQLKRDFHERVRRRPGPRQRPETDDEREWNDVKPARPWADARDYVRHGWDWSRRRD